MPEYEVDTTLSAELITWVQAPRPASAIEVYLDDYGDRPLRIETWLWQGEGVTVCLGSTYARATPPRRAVVVWWSSSGVLPDVLRQQVEQVTRDFDAKLPTILPGVGHA